MRERGWQCLWILGADLLYRPFLAKPPHLGSDKAWKFNCCMELLVVSWSFFMPLLKVTKVGESQLQTVWVPEWGAARKWQVVGTVSRAGHSPVVMINGLGLLWLAPTCQSLIKSSPNTLPLWTRIERIGRVLFPSETQAWEWPEQARWTGSPEGSWNLCVLPASSPEISCLPEVINSVHLSKKVPHEGKQHTEDRLI